MVRQFEGGRILTYRLGFDEATQGYFVVGAVYRDNGSPVCAAGPGTAPAPPTAGPTTWRGIKYSLVLVFGDTAILSRHSLVRVR